MSNFDLESLKSALTPEEVKFYTTARIAHDDHANWTRLLGLQNKVKDSQIVANTKKIKEEVKSKKLK